LTTRVRFAPAAQAELDDAAQWCERRTAGVGAALVQAVYEAAEGIEQWPGIGAVIESLPTDRVVRRYPVAGFPYHLVGVHADDEIYVVAVPYNRRAPRYWSQRVEGL